MATETPVATAVNAFHRYLNVYEKEGFGYS